MQARDKCVLCTGTLEPFCTFPTFPIKCFNATDIPNVSWDMSLGFCKSCGSVNQMNLLDPNILYGGKYPFDTSYSAVWSEHHSKFSEFIRNNIPKVPVFEIGSSSLVLAKKLVEDYQDYTIFDFSLETAQVLPEFKYIEGNCETYSFPSDSCVIMSHVFEHLYEPRKFVENCKMSGVSHIVISIPNMDDEARVSVTREHTFTYCTKDIEYIFRTYGYCLNSCEKFKDDHSVFYHFTTSTPPRWLPSKYYFNQKFTVPPDTYLVGAGFWSQVAYHSIENRENVIGVVDNDVNKQGRVFYGTEFVIENFDTLKNAKNAIVLANKYWTEEVTQHIKSINPDINIVSL